MKSRNKIVPRWRTRLFTSSRARYGFMVWLISFAAIYANAQFTDNFSDGDFTNNPAWNSDVPANWTIENGRLRSNSSTASSSFYISTPSAKVTEAQWEFFINLQFNTSSANLIDVYLVSANENLLNPGNNGYFVRIGGTPDEVSLFKIVGGTASILINGTDGVTNFSNNMLRIKVIRDANNLWTLSYDKTGTGNSYFDEPPATDNTFTTGNFFGIRILQSTASFFNRHFFDDIYAGEIITDQEPPVIVSATPQSSTQLLVLFSEKVDVVTAQTTSNYTVNNGTGPPISAALQPDEQTVQLNFSTSFKNGVTSQLTVTNVSDFSGNSIVTATADFFFFQSMPVSPKDIIVTEIFADPSPTIGLPEAEFIELHNRSMNPVNLNGWKFSDPSSTATLPNYILSPSSYVIITSNASVSLFSLFGPVVGVSNFPTLNNSGDNLTLKDDQNVIIDEVNYLDSWYKDDDKKQGGWTLELIDVQNICSEDENWGVSVHVSGGTPGKENSVKADKPDFTGPKLLSAIPLSSSQLKLLFNEKLQNEVPAKTSFTLVPSIEVSAVSYSSNTLREILLDLEATIQPKLSYTVTAHPIRDCAGNFILEEAKTVSFGFPETAAPMDVVINEILFNPRSFGVDFLELYNRSGKYLNLKNWRIGNYDNGVINLEAITASDFLFPPQAILAFTTDPLTVKSHYPAANLGLLIKVNSMPSFPDSEGSVSLVDDQGTVIDHFIYSNDFHTVFLRDKEGVSLERIHADAITNDHNNWKSASSTVGFATPGSRNSNSINTQTTAGDVTIEPEIFIPLFGQPDFTEIKYNFAQGGHVANIKIMDQQGREIRRIANNETLASNGFFRWDGDRDDGTKARPGYYLVWFEIFNTSGTVETFRKRIVIAARY